MYANEQGSDGYSDFCQRTDRLSRLSFHPPSASRQQLHSATMRLLSFLEGAENPARSGLFFSGNRLTLFAASAKARHATPCGVETVKKSTVEWAKRSEPIKRD